MGALIESIAFSDDRGIFSIGKTALPVAPVTFEPCRMEWIPDHPE